MTETMNHRDARKAVQSYVSRRIGVLQSHYMSQGKQGGSARQFAVLRRAAAKLPGSAPESWALEFEGLPRELIGKGGDASPAEWAVHIALTLYAVHQQSRQSEMYRMGRDYDIGAAMRQYVISAGKGNLKDGELPRRFAAMSTADSIREVAHYARQIVQLLRAESIPVDYGVFAGQLFDFQDPYYRDGVRLEWGRAYARQRSATAESVTDHKE